MLIGARGRPAGSRRRRRTRAAPRREALQHRAQDVEERLLQSPGGDGSSRRRRRLCEPSLRPTICSLRYAPAQSTRPGSTECSNWNSRFVTDPVGGDDDRHHDVRLQQQHLHVAHGGRFDRRRRHERQQSRELREHVRRRLERGLELVPLLGELERKRRRPRLEALEQAVGEEPVAVVGRHAAGRCVRMREEALPLELGELAAHGRRRDVQARPLDERLRCDRLAGRDVLLHDEAEDLALSLRQLDLHYVSV